MNDLERLLSRITISDNGCWIYPTRSDYGVFARKDEGHRSAMSTHRFVYSELVGRIPEGLQLDHLCRVRACCNPDHLEPVTPAENTRRSIPYRSGNTKVAKVASTQRHGGYGATMSDASPYMTYQEAADYLRVSRDTIRRYVRLGRLEAFTREGTNRKVVTRKSVEDLIR